MSFFKTLTWVLTMTLPCAASQAAGEPASKQNPATQSLMQGIFAPLSEVIPLSFDRETFSSKKNRPVIEKNLKALSDNAVLLERHGATQPRAFEYVAKSLATDARRAYRWYSKGNYEEAEFVVHNITENCIECHASLPETHKVPRAEKFFADLKIDRLMPLERAHLQIVSRQFDDALKTYETLFLSDELHPSLTDSLASFTNYLKVAIEVKSDFARPREMLEKLKAKPGTQPMVLAQIDKWITALKSFESRKVLDTTTLPAARAIVEEGRAVMEYAKDRDGLIHYLTAQAMLGRFIKSRPDRGVEVAEAYYLLGITESLTSHSFWVSRAEFDLESAIRLAPGAPFAPKAYALLEDSYTFGYSGSSGTNIPDDVKRLLFELRRVIEENQGKRI